MKLGPTKLDSTPCSVILAKIEYTNALKEYAAKTIKWGDEPLSKLKSELRISLRAQQERRCVYCRRIMLVERRNTAEDIEHFLDKSKPAYFKWSFESNNLALACHPCNFQKSGANLGSVAIAAAATYVLTPGTYRWIHPYLDEYHANITIGHGWSYVVDPTGPASLQAQQMIDECKLEEVLNTEAYAEKIKNEIFRLTCEVGAAMRRKDYDSAELLNTECEMYQLENWFSF
jgi:uncharacterized protein (TIGR02646 family)